MGRSTVLPDDPNAEITLRLMQLIWEDGDYDEGGAYWGHVPGEHIFWATGPCGEEDVEVFVKAKSRVDACNKILRDEIPGAKFISNSGLTELTLGGFLTLFEEDQHARLKQAHEDGMSDDDVQGIVCFENRQMDSSAFGARSAVIIGPGKTFELDTITPDVRIGETPSRFQYARYFLGC